MMRRHWATGALLLTVTLSGCTSAAEPGSTPTSTPVVSSSTTSGPTSATSDPTPTPSPTPEPVVLTPEQTVRAWVKAYNKVVTTGEPEDIRALSTSRCSQCDDIGSNFTGLYGNGGSVDTTGWFIERVKRRPDFDRNGQVVASIISGRSVIVREPGAKPEQEAKETFFVQWTLGSDQGRWLVDELAFIQ